MQKNIGDIKLGKYPYTYVRSAVMKSLLFKKADYDKMLKMGFDDIARFLQETSYKNEINELATQYSGSDLLELALNRSLAYSFKKLIRISPKELGIIIREYAKRKDIEDIKTIIRGKFTNADEKSIVASLTAAGTLNSEFLLSLVKKANIEEVLKNNGLVGYGIFAGAIGEFNEKKSLAPIENVLEKWYYNRLLEFSKMLPTQGTLFRNFLIKEIEVQDLLTIFRLLRMHYKKDHIKNFLISKGAGIIRLAEAESIEELAKLLEKTKYKKNIEKGLQEFREKDSLIALESELYRLLLREASLLLHQHPLSVDMILGYMLAKDIEVRNLKLLVKGKQLGLSESFIEREMVC